MKNILVAGLICLLFASCGPRIPDIKSLVSSQPMVVSASPEDGETASPSTKVEVSFTIPIDAASIDSTSFALVELKNELSDVNELAEDICDGDTDVVPGAYDVSQDGLTATFIPGALLPSGKKIAIVVTSLVRTVSYLPLNQTPGDAPSPYVSTFTVGGEGGVQAAESEVSEDSAGVGGQETVVRGPRPSWLIINELLYDASGNETDGNLFVELAGEAQSDIGGYQVVFINGADGRITETINIEDGALIADDSIFLIADSRTGASDETNIAGADMLDNFDPQNGPDCVQLLDDHGALVDALGYGTPLSAAAENGIACFENISAADAGAGKSLSRTDMMDTNDNSVDFILNDIPTPGIP